MKSPILNWLAQSGARGGAHIADQLDLNLKRAFEHFGLPTPDKTRGQVFARALRGYAARLEASQGERRK